LGAGRGLKRQAPRHLPKGETQIAGIVRKQGIVVDASPC
jgi:hypothetical protein